MSPTPIYMKKASDDAVDAAYWKKCDRVIPTKISHDLRIDTIGKNNRERKNE